jgi:NADH-quinone oxidoreductase subunit L
MIQLVWLIPILPLIGFLVNGIGRNRLPKSVAGVVGSAAILVSFILSLCIFFELRSGETKSFTIELFNWISAGNLHIPFSFLVDPLSVLMLLIITGVGFLIHVYSIGYMHDDEGFARYFAYLNLFVFFMMLLVLGANYVIMFIGWEGVGLCSYLLIGFWFKKQEYNNAAKKAFIMNRIGDLGFLLGVFLIFNTFGSVSFAEVLPRAAGFVQGDTVLTAITLLLFIGATGKSAQLPLYTWLPDAMAGPTPVSALIHAATMVTAGIYMIARSSAMFVLAPFTMDVIAIIGVATAIFAALIALTQTDIKKVLAYSTVSQLGYMFLGLGVGAFTGSVFHLMTHAFFKALLFLGAGSVIHAMSGEQDMRKMGGLKKALPVTFVTMLLATFAISGLPPFSGFFSKDEILAHAYEHSPVLWGLGVVGALLTAFYMFRMMFLTFYGGFRGTHEQQHHLHESPKNMTIPLIVLAVLSVIGGFINIPHVLGGGESLHHYLAPVFTYASAYIPELSLDHTTEFVLMGVSVLGVLISIFFAYTKYVKKSEVPAAEGTRLPALQAASYNKFYIDELYDNVFRKPLDALSDFFYKVIDKTGIDGVVNGFGKAVMEGSKNLRLLQTGYTGFYIFAMVIGIILIMVLNFFLM